MHPFFESIFLELEQHIMNGNDDRKSAENRKISDIIQGYQISVSDLIDAKKRKEIDRDSFDIELEREREVLITQLSGCEKLNSITTNEYVNVAVDRLRNLLKL